MAISLEYAAGIIDGEGCIRVYKHKLPKKQGNYPFVTSRLTVAMLSKEIIEALQTSFGGTAKAYPRKDRRHPVWIWYLSEQKAAALLRQLLPFLIEKRAQAELLIDLAERKDPLHRTRITEVEAAYREALVEKCRSLKNG